jgi:hypothetical protein
MFVPGRTRTELERRSSWNALCPIRIKWSMPTVECFRTLPGRSAAAYDSQLWGKADASVFCLQYPIRSCKGHPIAVVTMLPKSGSSESLMARSHLLKMWRPGVVNSVCAILHLLHDTAPKRARIHLDQPVKRDTQRDMCWSAPLTEPRRRFP